MKKEEATTRNVAQPPSAVAAATNAVDGAQPPPPARAATEPDVAQPPSAVAAATEPTRTLPPIERALRRLAERRRETTTSADLETMNAPTFRAVVAHRLRALEAELADVRLRINGLIFVTVSAVIVSVLERLLI